MEHRGVGNEGTSEKPGPTVPSKKLGTLGTAKTIVKHRGLMGLYSGFHLHLRKSYLTFLNFDGRLITCKSPGHDRHSTIFHNVRKQQTAAR